MGGIFGGGSSKQVTTVKENADPWKPVQPYLKDLFSRAGGAIQQVSTAPYLAPRWAGPTAQQYQGLDLAQQFAGANAGMGQDTIDLARRTLAGEFLDPSTNPALAGAVRAAQAPILDEFTRSIMPSLTSAAIQQGAYGGAREGITQAVAASELARRLGDISAQMYGEAYDAERNRQILAPQMMSQGYTLGMMPAETLGQVGTTLQGWDQGYLDELYRRFMEENTAPFRGLDMLAGLLSGTGAWGSSTAQTTAPQTGASPVLSGAIGGGLLGLQAANLTGSTNPWWGVGGAILGGLLGL